MLSQGAKDFPLLMAFLQSGEDLPPVQSNPNEGVRRYFEGDLDFEELVVLRRQHETLQSKEGVRSRFNENCAGEPEGSGQDSNGVTQTSHASIRSGLARQFSDALHDQRTKAPGTGTERKLRWTAHNTGLSDSNNAKMSGNVANAAATAKRAAASVS
jgi:hypothetical protein